MATIIARDAREHVFSSRTGCWEQRTFAREGEPAGTMADMQRAAVSQKRYGVYWRGGALRAFPKWFLLQDVNIRW
jgi:hypothetical protein